MPTSFFGLFLLSTALSLAATFIVVAAKAAIRRSRALSSEVEAQRIER